MLNLDDRGCLLPATAKRRATQWPHRLAYLASPYTHSDAETRRLRHRVACYSAGILLQAGCKVFSPIAHSHKICEHANMAGDWGTWQEFDLHMLSMCDLLIMLMLPGWQKSQGMEAEYQAFVGRGQGQCLFWLGPNSPFIAAPPPIQGKLPYSWREIQLFVSST